MVKCGVGFLVLRGRHSEHPFTRVSTSPKVGGTWHRNSTAEMSREIPKVPWARVSSSRPLTHPCVRVCNSQVARPRYMAGMAL